MRYVIGDSRPRVLFVLPSFEGRDYVGDAEELAREFEIDTVVWIGPPTDARAGFAEFVEAGRSR